VREIDRAGLDLYAAFAPLLDIIERAQTRAYRAVNHELVGMYWDIGEHLSDKAKSEGWGRGVVKDLERQIDSLLYERTMASNEANKEIIARHPTLASLRDAYSLEFLGLPEEHRERDLRGA
jgi:hypothetical protein